MFLILFKFTTISEHLNFTFLSFEVNSGCAVARGLFLEITVVGEYFDSTAV